MRTLYKKGQFDISGAGVVTYVVEFTGGDIITEDTKHILRFRHEILNSSGCPMVLVYDDSNQMVIPDGVALRDDMNTIDVDLTSFDTPTPITGTWHVWVIGN